MSAQHLLFTPANLPLFLYSHGGPTRFFARGPGLHPGAEPRSPVSFCQKAESDARLREDGKNGVFRRLQRTVFQRLAEGLEKHCGARGFPLRSEGFSSAEKIRALRGGKNFSPQRKSSETEHADCQRLVHKSKKQPRKWNFVNERARASCRYPGKCSYLCGRALGLELPPPPYLLVPSRPPAAACAGVPPLSTSAGRPALCL